MSGGRVCMWGRYFFFLIIRHSAQESETGTVLEGPPVFSFCVHIHINAHRRCLTNNRNVFLFVTKKKEIVEKQNLITVSLF